METGSIQPDRSRSLRQWVMLYFKGMAMGAADSVPGVSGGTVAFMTGIYEELVYSLQSVNHKALQTLFTRGVPACWRQVNAGFLLVLLAGIGSSILLLANLMVWLLQNHTPQVLSFFAGLILASTVYLIQKAGKWPAPAYMRFMIGLAFAVVLGLLPGFNAEPALLTFFLGGMVAITAMILPGISGAFILVLLGLYLPVLDALRNLDLPVVAVFIAGCATGLIAFSQVLGWLFRQHHDSTLQVLTGILAGSLWNLWPWQLGEEGMGTPVLPATYAGMSGDSADIPVCLLLVLAGFILVLGLEYWSSRTRSPTH